MVTSILETTLQENSCFYYSLWHKGRWKSLPQNDPFFKASELIKASVERIKKVSPELYNDITLGTKPLIDISLKSDEKRLAQCFVQESGNLEIFFEPNNIINMLDTLKTDEDKISCLTYLVAHEMEHAYQGQKGDVLYIKGKDKGKAPAIEKEIALEIDATAVGIATASKAGLTPSAKKVLKEWFKNIIPNLGSILDSEKKAQEIEKDIFKEDLKNRISYYKKKGNKIGSFSSELQKVVRHPDILKEYNHLSSMNISQNLNHTL